VTYCWRNSKWRSYDGLGPFSRIDTRLFARSAVGCLVQIVLQLRERIRVAGWPSLVCLTSHWEKEVDCDRGWRQRWQRRFRQWDRALPRHFPSRDFSSPDRLSWKWMTYVELYSRIEYLMSLSSGGWCVNIAALQPREDCVAGRHRWSHVYCTRCRCYSSSASKSLMSKLKTNEAWR